MKNIILILLILFGTTSCSDNRKMTNEEIIEQTKLCESAGMDSYQRINGFTLDVVGVVCSRNYNK